METGNIDNKTVSVDTVLPLVVIVGPTASGKSSLAITLAEKHNGEIICADSRTVYKHLDIGTAKPTIADQARVPHWGLDLVEPNERYTAADFKSYAIQKIIEIRSRGRVPFLVGGTGLYVDAVVYDYQFGQKVDPVRREYLESLSLETLQEYCIKNNILLPENSANKRYVIRVIEQNGVNEKRNKTPLSTSIIVGIATEKAILRTRIITRAEQLFKDGVVEESIILGKKYGWSSEAMKGNIYPLVQQYENGELTLPDMKEKFIIADARLAKKQITWLKRNKDIVWLSSHEAEHYISQKIALSTSS